MTSLLRLRRQSEEFAARVDAQGGSPVDPRSDRLLAVVTELRRHGAAVVCDPRPEFAAELRTRLMADAATVLDQQATLTLPGRPRSRRERRLVAAATVAVLVAGGGGMAAASQHALPGEALYPVKRAIERVQAGTATSSAARGRDLLSQASGRLEEVRGLLDSDSGAASAEVPGTLEEFRGQARAGADQLMASYRDTHDPEIVATVRQFAARDLSVLTALTTEAPAEVEPSLRAAAGTLRSIDREASGLCPDCTSLPPLRLPSALTVTAEVDRALARARNDAPGLDNDHPVLVPKGLVDGTGAGAAKPAAPQRGRAGPSAAPPATKPSASTPTAAAPDGHGQPSGLPGVLGSALPTAQPTATSGKTSGNTSGKRHTGGGSSAGPTGVPDIGDTLGTLLPDLPTPTIKPPLP